MIGIRVPPPPYEGGGRVYVVGTCYKNPFKFRLSKTVNLVQTNTTALMLSLLLTYRRKQRNKCHIQMRQCHGGKITSKIFLSYSVLQQKH